jgi:glycosyltransferase involved in cell wall biosynthesis
MENSLLIVVPCYNEEEILNSSAIKFIDYLQSLIIKKLVSPSSKICLVDDGSNDSTWEIIKSITSVNPTVASIKLSKNFGHQSAVLAGLLENEGKFDSFITIDADLQDDITVIEKMVKSYNNGSHVVYGVRDDRSSDSFFKKFTAESFYKIMGEMGVPVVFNHADFRLMSNEIIKHLADYKEVNLFIRGIIPTIGFKSDKVFYARKIREAGESKYPLSKMLSFAWNGITSFSTTPMKLVLWFGIFNFLLAIGITFYVIISKFMGATVQGWTSTLLPMAYFSGSNMIAVGLIGEYLGKVYEEIKARPRYIVEEKQNLA